MVGFNVGSGWRFQVSPLTLFAYFCFGFRKRILAANETFAHWRRPLFGNCRSLSSFFTNVSAISLFSQSNRKNALPEIAFIRGRISFNFCHWLFSLAVFG